MSRGAPRIVVTGGAGFIGSHTVEALVAGGHTVLVVDDLSHACGATLPTGTDMLTADCGSDEAAAALRAFRPDVALHLASKGGVNVALRDPATHIRRSVASSVAFFRAACEAGAHTVVTASSGGAAYGDAPRLPAAESQRPAPRSPYGAGKVAEEVYLFAFARLHRVRALALRYANVYGPRQDGTGEAGVVAITCWRLLSGKQPLIHGDGEQTRDFINVADVAAANLAAVRSRRSGSVNIGTGRDSSVRFVVETLASHHDGGSPVTFGPARDGEVRRVCLSTARAASWLGWEATVGLAGGLEQTYAWFREHDADGGRHSGTPI